MRALVAYASVSIIWVQIAGCLSATPTTSEQGTIFIARPDLGENFSVIDLEPGNAWIATFFRIPADAWRANAAGAYSVRATGVAGGAMPGASATLLFRHENEELRLLSAMEGLDGWFISNSGRPSDMDYLVLLAYENLPGAGRVEIGVVDEEGRHAGEPFTSGVFARGSNPSVAYHITTTEPPRSHRVEEQREPSPGGLPVGPPGLFTLATKHLDASDPMFHVATLSFSSIARAGEWTVTLSQDGKSVEQSGNVADIGRAMAVSARALQTDEPTVSMGFELRSQTPDVWPQIRFVSVALPQGGWRGFATFEEAFEIEGEALLAEGGPTSLSSP